jgi:hypothetical protein
MSVTLTTASGQSLSFDIYDFYGNWYQVGGLYAFAYYDYVLKRWRILYIGQTDNFKTRMTNKHHRWSAAVDLGACVVLACGLEYELVRRVWETALIEHYKPVLNIQHNPIALGPKSLRDMISR